MRAVASLALLAAMAAGVMSHPFPRVAAEPAATPPVGDIGPVDWGDDTPTVRDAKAYARRVLGSWHYACLDAIATRESGWRPLARNPESGAAGIFQALPPDKMRRYGADYLTNPLVQVRFGIAYSRARYGSPCGAWDFWRLNGWW